MSESASENGVQVVDAKNLRKFENGRAENAKFWSRMGQKPDFAGARVLEVGSGCGSLAVEIALDGAAKVVGLDLHSRSVDFATAHLADRFGELEGKVEFQCRHLQDYEDAAFDIIVSKDTFEHIIDLDGMLREMKKRLAPGGRIYTGFGPIYTSPFGDHDRRKTILAASGTAGRIIPRIPWGHLFLEKRLVEVYNRRNERKITSLGDLGLNKLAPSDYRRAFRDAGLDAVLLRKNRGGGAPGRLVALLGIFPPLADYCTYNLYCVLEAA